MALAPTLISFSLSVASGQSFDSSGKTGAEPCFTGRADPPTGWAKFRTPRRLWVNLRRRRVVQTSPLLPRLPPRRMHPPASGYRRRFGSRDTDGRGRREAVMRLVRPRARSSPRRPRGGGAGRVGAPRAQRERAHRTYLKKKARVAGGQAPVSGITLASVRLCRFGRELHASSTTFPLLRRASM
jgi:hypothetical protein